MIAINGIFKIMSAYLQETAYKNHLAGYSGVFMVIVAFHRDVKLT